MKFWKEKHRGKVSFLPHCIKRVSVSSTWLVPVDVDLALPAEIEFVRDHSGFLTVHKCRVSSHRYFRHPASPQTSSQPVNVESVPIDTSDTPRPPEQCWGWVHVAAVLCPWHPMDLLFERPASFLRAIVMERRPPHFLLRVQTPQHFLSQVLTSYKKINSRYCST